MKPTITWVLIADGAEARVFEHRGPDKGLVAIESAGLSQEPLRDQQIVSDRPGRTFSSVGYGRSAIEPQTDPAQYREAEFMRRVAAMLDAQHRAGAYQRLIIAAAPTALGDLRPHLSEAVRRAVTAELPKDLTRIPQPQLAAHFADILAV